MPLTGLRTLVSWGGRPTSGTYRIVAAPKSPTNLDCTNTLLKDVCEYFSDFHRIRIQSDARLLRSAKIDEDVPITGNLKGISLGDALHVLLTDLGLDWSVRRDVLLITTKESIVKRHPEAVELQRALPNLMFVIVDTAGM